MQSKYRNTAANGVQTAKDSQAASHEEVSQSHDACALRLFFELSQLVDTATHIEDTLDGALQLMARHLSIVRGSIFLVSPQKGTLHLEASYGFDPIAKARGYALEESIGKVIATGNPFYGAHATEKGIDAHGARSKNMQTESLSFVCVPIKRHGVVFGVLCVEKACTAATEVEEDVRVLCVIASILARVAENRQDHMQNMHTSTTAPRPHAFVGNSEAMQHVYTQIEQVASSCTTVLICGESGTGKELTAQAIHAASPRADCPYVSLNCAALPEGLIESELFGHEKGAFTGATAVRRGRFEMADGGTLFLDEIGELSLFIQAKLLRVLQDRRFERLGSMQTQQVDIRIIAATNRPLEEMVEQGTFRKDLYYRLNVFPITLTPLRERKHDIVLLANHFMGKFAAANGRSHCRLSLTAVDMLQRYDWPGNARELQNVMERAMLLVGDDGFVLPQHLPANIHTPHCPTVYAGTVSDHNGSEAVPSFLQTRLDELEYACIVESLEAHHGHLGKAAESLGLTERIMGLRLKKYGLKYKEFRTKP